MNINKLSEETAAEWINQICDTCFFCVEYEEEQVGKCRIDPPILDEYGYLTYQIVLKSNSEKKTEACSHWRPKKEEN